MTVGLPALTPLCVYVLAIAPALAQIRAQVRAEGEGPSLDSIVTRGPGLEPELHDGFHWVRFGEEHGLPDDHVTRVLDAGDGTTWAVTHKGLAWYDGHRWHAAVGLAGAHIGDFASDREGNILVLSRDGAYLGHRGGFERVALPTVRGWACEPTPDGRILLLDDPTGRDDVTTSTIFSEAQGAVAGPALPREQFPRMGTLHSTRNADSLWLINSGHLRRWSAGQWTDHSELPADFAPTLIAMRDGAGAGLAFVNYPHSERGVWEWNEDGTLERLFLTPTQLPVSMDIAPSGDAIIVFETREVIVRQNDVWTTLVPQPREMSRINSAAFRADGSMWAATDSGLYLYRKQFEHVRSWRHGSEDSLAARALEYIETSDGSLWIGTSTGVERHSELGKEDTRSENTRSIDGTRLLTITGLCEDADGNVWISSGDGSFAGAYRWDGEEWRHFGSDEGLDCAAIHRIRLDRQGRVWFLGIAAHGGVEPGAFVYDGARFERWDTERGLTSNRVYDFAEDAGGACWFGTGGGISRWHEGEWTHWTKATGLVHDRVSTLAVDREGRIWFGHELCAGLGVIEGGEVRYEPMTPDGQGLSVHEIALDDDGAPWAATPAGLWARIEGQPVFLTAEDGLGSDRIGAVYPLADRIVVGPLDGHTVIIQRETQDSAPPSVRIEPRDAENPRAALRWSVASHWGERNAAKVPTRHRIDEGEWSPWSTDRERSLAGLPDGDHAFEIQVKNALGSAAVASDKLVFTLPQPLHRSTAFRLSLAALILLLLIEGRTIFAQRARERRRVGESESRFRQLAENIHEVFWLIDTRNREVLYVSPTVEEVWGLAPADLLGPVASRLAAVHEEDSARVDAAFAQAHVIDYDEVYRIRRPDGSVRWVRDRAFPIRDRSGVVYRIAGITEDITVGKEAAHALNYSEERYRSLVEAVPDGILIQRDGVFVFASPSGAEMLGADSPAGVVGCPLEKVVHPDSYADTMVRLSAIAASDLPVPRFDARFRRFDGGLIDVEVAGMTILFDDHVATQILLRDTTSRKRDEQRQALLMRELDHRVKNNLASILAMAEQSVTRARGLAEFAESFTSRVRAMARTHEALASARWLGVPFEQIVRLMTSPFDTEGDRVESAGPNIVIRSIATAPLSIAIHELGTNAIKHGVLGRDEGHLSITWSFDKSGLHIVWAESGSASAPTAPSVEGVGLGLVRGVIEYELGGATRFDFDPAGLTVHLDLPEMAILETLSSKDGLHAPT